MANDRESWLKLTAEEALEPELPICDAHHHFWDSPGKHYMFEELLRDTAGGHRIIQTVFIDCELMYRKGGPKEMRPVGETEFVAGLAERYAGKKGAVTDVAAGIVSDADLTLGDAVAPVLEAHIAASPERFRGIRCVAAWHDDPGVIVVRPRPRGRLMDPAFRKGFALLKKYNLTFDAWVYHTQLLELTDLARAFTDTIIILDHYGAPIGMGPYAGKRAEVFEEWSQKMLTLAALPNVFVKLGGLGMLLCGFGWNERPAPPGSTELAAAMAPYFDWCIEHFGVERCIFESNFPVDRLSYSYTVLWNAFKRYSRGFSPSERAALFHGNAQKVYRLKTNQS